MSYVVDQTIDNQILQNWEEHNDSGATMFLAHQFRRRGQLTIRGLVPDEVRLELKNEVFQLLDRYSERRDLLLSTTGGTPRHMEVVRSETIAKYGSYIGKLYHSKALINLLERIAGEKLYACPSPDEEFLITRQIRKGDTHGWHWGDYRYALIWIVEAPPLENGGMLQCVPHTIWNKKEPQIHHYLCENPIDTYGFETGDIYFLRADTTLHRTVPLVKDSVRIMLNMTWACKKDVNQELKWDDRWWDNQNVKEAIQPAHES